MLSQGNIADNLVAIGLLYTVDITNCNILADKAYGTNAIREYIKSKNAFYTIPPKSNTLEPWYRDFHVYKERRLIECFSMKSRLLDELQQDMINWQVHF